MVTHIKNMAILSSMVLLAAFFVVAGNERLRGDGTNEQFAQGQFAQEQFDQEQFAPGEAVLVTGDNQYIKWVDFNVSYEALCAAYDLDVGSYDQPVHLNWIELLAYVGTKSGGSFGRDAVAAIEKVAAELSEKKVTMAELTSDMKNYDYYYQAYEAVLGGMVGEFEIERETETGEKTWTKLYGLKAFLPIAHGFPYNDYDDFGVSRSYGYRRNHLGHDMMGQVGTPI